MRFHAGTIFFMTIILAFSVLLMGNFHGDDLRAEEPGYHTYEEVMIDYQGVAGDYPEITEFINLTDRYETPMTHGNRSLYALRITDHDEDPADSEREPAILLTSIHHAREWISVEVTSHFMHYLVDNYGTDPYVTYLVDNRDIWIIPFVNPDGYIQSWDQYDRDKNYTGWRKNIRDNNDDGTIDNGDGVDLNRNYGFEWGYDEAGSSGDSGSTTYRGPAPFSEAEVQTVAALCNDTKFQVAIHFHSKGNLILYPWAYESLDTSDHDAFVMMGEQMSQYNGYVHGNTRDGVIYKCNGEACDWMYAEHGTFALTVELGFDEDRYIPDETRILPIYEENLYSTLFACYVADDPGAHIGMADPEPGSDGTDSWLHDGEGEHWSISPESMVGTASWSITTGDEIETHANLTLNQTLVAGENYTILRFWERSDISDGTTTGIYLEDTEGALTEVTERITGIQGEEEGRGDEDNGKGRGEESRGAGDEWTIVYYNLTPFLDAEPQTLTFTIDSLAENEGDVWYVDGVLISSSYPSEFTTASDDRGPGDGEFSITPLQRNLLLLPDVTQVVTVDITNDDTQDNTIEFSGNSDRGWQFNISYDGNEVDEVSLEADETITLDITIHIPAGLVADEAGNFSIDFWSKDNLSQNHTHEIKVTIDTFYHIVLGNPGNIHMLPDEQLLVQLGIQNLGNSPIQINQGDPVPTFGNADGWEFTYDEDPMVEAYGSGMINLSVIAPAQIDKDVQLAIEITVRVDGHSSGDGTDEQEFFFIIDEIIAAGFEELDTPMIKPGTETEFKVKLFNHGNVRERFYISIVSGWVASINKNSVEVDSYGSEIITLLLTAPVDTNDGETGTVIFRVDNPIQNSTTNTFTAIPFFQVSLSSTKLNNTIPAGREKVLRLNVHNDGNAENTIFLVPSSVDGFDVSISPSEVTISQHFNKQVDILVNVSISKPFDQDNSIEIIATSDLDPTEQAILSFRVTVGRSYEVKLDIDSDSRKQTVSPKEPVDYIISIQNLGNAETTIDLSVEDVPAKWTAVLDDSAVSIPSGKYRYVRLTLTAPGGARNNDEARVTVVASAGDSSFGDVTDEVIAVAVVSADDSEGGISGLLVAGILVIALLVVSVYLFLTQRSQADEDAGMYTDGAYGAYGDDGSSPDDSGASTTPASLTGSTGPVRQTVSCPKCDSSFDVELPSSDKPTVKTMCIECGEIFSFDRKVPEPELPPAPTGPVQQHVSCPTCDSDFDVELPPGDKPTVKTMCIECGEIFSFDRKISEPELPPAPTSPVQQHVSCPKCESDFDVELPPGDKPTVKTMCVECGEIFSFDRKIPEPEVPPTPIGPVQQHVSCPECQSSFDVELPPGDKPNVKTMCIECGSIFSFDRSPPTTGLQEKASAIDPRDEEETPPPIGLGTSPDLADDASIPPPSSSEPPQPLHPSTETPLPSIPSQPTRSPSEPSQLQPPQDSEKPPWEQAPHSDPTRPRADGPQTSVPIKTGETREVKKDPLEGKRPEGPHDSHVELPKVMKCPKCGRKVFLKGGEVKVKCIFCGTRIQFERRKRGPSRDGQK